MIINYILAFSNFIGLYIVYKNKYGHRIFNIFVLLVIYVSFLHHLTGINQVNHNLRDKYYLLDNYGDQLRYIDMIFAYSFYFYYKKTWIQSQYDYIQSYKYFNHSTFM